MYYKLQDKDKLSDVELMEICSLVPVGKMEVIATRFLDIDIPELQMEQARWKDDELLKCGLLRIWCNRNPENTRKKLFDVLTKAAHAGLIHPKAFASLDEERGAALMKGMSAKFLFDLFLLAL